MRQPVQMLLGLVLAGAVAACGGAAATPSPRPVITIDGAEFTFTPAAIEVDGDAGATISLRNVGTIEHDFTIDALAFTVHTTAGETASGDLTAAQGTYDFYCSIPGHKEAGMVGVLTVE